MKHKSHREWPLESRGRVDQTQKCGHYNQKQSQCLRARRTPMCFGGKSDKAESCRRFCITIFLANGSKIFRIQKFSIFDFFFFNSRIRNFEIVILIVILEIIIFKFFSGEKERFDPKISPVSTKIQRLEMERNSIPKSWESRSENHSIRCPPKNGS